MDSTFVEYLVFFVAVLIVMWAALALNKYISRHNPPDKQSFDNWVELDIKHPEPREDLTHKQRGAEDEDEDENAAKLYTRASQNGHHAKSQSPPL
ncbi:MAG: hypothetical protein ABI234_07635 [Ktedonobacteraceae bacterium]